MMENFEKITSVQNARIKNVIKLQKPSERRRQGLFVIEGFREIQLAGDNGYCFSEMYFCSEIADAQSMQSILQQQEKCKCIEVSMAVYEKMAVRENKDGIIVIAKTKQHHLSQIQLSDNPLIMVLEAVEKPGNLGAVLRTADAAAIDAVIICEPNTDFYNANVIRNSLGCVFTNQTAAAATAEVIAWLKKNNITIFASILQTDNFYHEVNFKQPSALVMGTEATGLSEEWRQAADYCIKIPMLGKIDSLNVSNAAAVLLFEALRQRGFKKNTLLFE